MAATPPRESLENNEPKTPPHTTTQIQPPTPTVPSNAASQPYTSTHVFRTEAIKTMYQEITGKVLGPMPLKDFLNEFVPAAQGPAPVPNPEALEKLRVANTEYAMYEPFVSDSIIFSPFLSLISFSRSKLSSHVAPRCISVIPITFRSKPTSRGTLNPI